MEKNNPLVLAILDGWGVGLKKKQINAIFAAKTPFFDDVVLNRPYTQLGATGTDVGLEKNQMSGSEAGHLNIGAGRIVKQDVRNILESIDSGNFFKKPVFLSAIKHAKKNGSNIHLLGLLGNEDSPHSHPDILLALLLLIKKFGLSDKSFVHFFTDGRDSHQQSALRHWKRWKRAFEIEKLAKCASVCGRFFAMDRTKNWERLKKAYDLIVQGDGHKCESFEEAVGNGYQENLSDEYIEPTSIVKNGKPIARVKNNDVVIFFNFRSDRARQFSKLFVGTKINKEIDYPKINQLENLFFVAMTNFGPDLNLHTAYPSNPLTSTLPVAMSSKKQLYISETEKFAHVTYFINGGYSDAVGGESRIIVESPKVKSYADIPQMSAQKITDLIIDDLAIEKHDFIVVNYPNADMVGHTGDFLATTKAVAEVDRQLMRVANKIQQKNGTLIITADHGNADIMYDEELNVPFTYHTKNPVPFSFISYNKRFDGVKFQDGGVLGNIAPTILDILEIRKPEEMSKDSLIS